MQNSGELIPDLPNADFFSDHLVRLPLYVGLTDEELEKVVEVVLRFGIK